MSTNLKERGRKATADIFQGTTDLWGEIKWVWRTGGWLGRALLITSSGCLAGEVALIAFAVAVLA